METCLANSRYKCIICEKDLSIEEPFQHDDNRFFPHVEGGVAMLHFSYPSRHDQHVCRIATSHEEYIIVICDDCFDKKCDLAKRVIVQESTRYILIHT